MKKIISIILSIAIMISSIPLSVFADLADEVTRYSVLVLDTSEERRFRKNDEIIYTADSAVEYVKASARSFVSNLIKAKGNNYVAVIAYSDSAEIISEFTNDYSLINNKIDEIVAFGGSNMSDGLDKAKALLEDVKDDVIKNVVLVTTGMVNEGDYSYFGHYNETTVGSLWLNSNTEINNYAYANVAYEKAATLKEIANLYVLGLFQTLEGMPEEGLDIAQFFRMTAREIATSDDMFFVIEDPNNIGFYFGEVSDDILDENIVSMNVYDHIAFIENNDNLFTSFTQNNVFERICEIATSDTGVLSREYMEAYKRMYDYWEVAKNLYIDENIDINNFVKDITNSELVAQMIVTELLSSEEIQTEIISTAKVGIGIADEQLLYALYMNPSELSVSEEDLLLIDNLINTIDKSNEDYISKRNEILSRYYSSNITISGSDINEIVGLMNSCYEMLKAFDRFSYLKAKHMAEPKENSLFEKINVLHFATNEVIKEFETAEDIKVFYENVNALASASYATQEALISLQSGLIEEYNYWIIDAIDFDINAESEYIERILFYLEDIKNAIGDHYNDYLKEKQSELIKNPIVNSLDFVTKNTFEGAVIAVLPLALVIMKLPVFLSDALLVLGSLFTNVDERIAERNYTLATAMIFKALANSFDKKTGYFAKKVVNDKTEYSVELYETGLAMYKKVAAMYERHAGKYIAMLMDSDAMRFMAKTILLPEDYEKYKLQSIIDDKPIISQLVVDSYSLNLWEMDISKIICHDEGTNDNIFVDSATKKKFYLIACPIDITIVNNNNGTVAKVVNDELSIMQQDNDVQIYTFVGDESDTLSKALFVPYDYKVVISGYDEGKMTVQKTIISNGFVISCSIFENIPVVADMHYTEIHDGDNLIAINGYDSHGNHVSLNDTVIDNPESTISETTQTIESESSEAPTDSAMPSSTQTPMKSMSSTDNNSLGNKISSKATKTGDDTNYSYLTILMIAIVMTTVLIVRRRRSNI